MLANVSRVPQRVLRSHPRLHSKEEEETEMEPPQQPKPKPQTLQMITDFYIKMIKDKCEGRFMEVHQF